MSWNSPKPNFVYFIKPVGMDGPIKIGCSESPERRKSSLETWSPFALEIVAQIAGGLTLERRFHAAFLHLHQRREWFSYGDDLWATVEAVAAGTFDVETLPEPRRVCNLGGTRSGPQTETQRRQQSYSVRVGHMVRRTGYACPTYPYGMIEENDLERIAKVEEYLADPLTHGIPIAADWAVAKRQAA